MKLTKKIFCTLGPSSLNRDFLEYITDKVSLVRLNLSHIEEDELFEYIAYIERHTSVDICIDTEGAQIRTKTKKTKKFEYGEKGSTDNFKFYPRIDFEKDDVLQVGFDNLIIKFLDTRNFVCISPGLFETNKGVHVINRKIKLDPLTPKDLRCIDISKKRNIENYALSFTNSVSDIKLFKDLLKDKNTIFKLETQKAVTNLNLLIKEADNFLIDRGDLSKEVTKELIPFTQRFIIKKVKEQNKNVFVATNHLESMIEKSYPTNAEINDIYSTLEMSADGIVLAAETAIGNNPIKCVDQCLKIMEVYGAQMGQ